MARHVTSVSLELVSALRPLVPRIKRHHRSLADQMMRAADSVALNTAEAEYSDPGNMRARLSTAAGSANETRAALRLAQAWGFVTPGDCQAALRLLDRICAMLYRLTHTR